MTVRTRLRGRVAEGKDRGAAAPLLRGHAPATPALLVDRPRLARNIAEMADRARSLGVNLWPHAKTHKSAAIAALQREAGAAGLTVATVAEAEYFAAHRCADILLAFPPVGEFRRDALAALAERTRIRVVLDDAGTLSQLVEACRAHGTRIPYLWEVDCGTGRLGTPPGEPSAAAIASAPATPECPFDGVMTFGGLAYGADSDAELRQAAESEAEALTATVDALQARGIEVRTRSAGTTPTAHAMTRRGPITELRPGNYVFYDATQVALGLVELDRCALTIQATVVGRPTEHRAILDAGSKALAAERMTARTPGFGAVLGHPAVSVTRLYEQHAVLDSEAPIDLALGTRVDIVPNHACAAANLHRQAIVVEDGERVDVWSVGAAGPGT